MTILKSFFSWMQEAADNQAKIKKEPRDLGWR
jgi:hypothetical protein